MREHVRMAKRSGIVGFIVSWKHTPQLDARLTKLVRVAEEESFKLAITYEGLNFDRDPLPVEQVAEGLDWFANDLASSPTFDLFGKPVVIWTGTEQLGVEELERTTAPRRSRLTLLASEKSEEGYMRVAHAFDGDSYYWSSADPFNESANLKRLQQLSEAVHDQHGLWFAPAAPGFDARLVGGTRVIDRKGGEALRRSLGTALQTSPNAVAIISWNEFSENTHIEPSQTYGATALNVLRDIAGAVSPITEDFGSDNTTGPPSLTNFLPLIGFAAVVVGSLCIIYWRSRAHRAECVEEADHV